MGIIGSIRKHSWIAVAVVGGAIIAFIIGDVWKNNSRIPDMGKINNSTITYQRFNELTEEMENNYKRQQGVSQVPTDVEYQLRDQVWQRQLRKPRYRPAHAVDGIGEGCQSRPQTAEI